MSNGVIQPIFRGRYSEAFKRQVVEEIERGGTTLSSISAKYGIRGHATVSRWYRQYSRFCQLQRHASLRIMEQKKPSAAQESERVRELERALADAQLKIRALETLIDLAEEKYHIPVRKNSGAKQSSD